MEGDDFLVPVVDGGGDYVHGHDPAHEGGRNAGREVSDEDILVGNACEGGVVLEMGNIFDMGREVGVILSLGHMFSGEPGDGISGGVIMFEHGFELRDEIREGFNGDNSTGDSILSEGSCPGEGGSFGHIG